MCYRFGGLLPAGHRQDTARLSRGLQPRFYGWAKRMLDDTPCRGVAFVRGEAKRRMSVLLVEDKRGLAASVVEALADAGLSAGHAGDGEEAPLPRAGCASTW